MAKKQKRPAKRKPYRMNRWGIKNHCGDVWSPNTFDTEAQAKEYIADQQRRFNGLDLRRHRAAPVRVTVSLITR